MPNVVTLVITQNKLGGVINTMERITVYLSKELKNEIKSRKISMSQIGRTGIKLWLKRQIAQRKYKKRYPEKHREQSRKWRKKHPNYKKEWLKKQKAIKN